MLENFRDTLEGCNLQDLGGDISILGGMDKRGTGQLRRFLIDFVLRLSGQLCFLRPE